MARTILLPGVSAEQEEAYQYFRDGVAATTDYVSAGVTLTEIRRFYHAQLKPREGWLLLSGPVVHGIGLQRPEEPRFYFPGSGYPDPIEANTTIACSNTGLSSRQGWGVRYEDTFIVTGGKPELLTAEQ